MWTRLALTLLLVGLLSTGSAGVPVVFAQPEPEDEATVEQVRVEGVRVGLTPGRTRLVLDLSDKLTDYKLLELESPARIELQISNAQLKQAVEQRIFRSTPINRISSERTGDEGLRLVIELSQVLARVQDFVLKPYAGRGHRLVVDLYPGQDRVEQVVNQSPELDKNSVDKAERHQQLVSEAEARERESEPGESPPVTQKSVDESPGDPVISSNVSQQPAAELAGRGAENSRTNPLEMQVDNRDMALGFEFSGTWEQEWAYAADHGGSQKYENLIEPRLDVRMGSRIDLTVIGQLRVDGVGDLGPSESWSDNYSPGSGHFYNSQNLGFSLREMYLDFRLGDSEWRLGKQQIVWGQADGIKVLDVVNPQTFREFILDDFDKSRIPLWTANVSLPVGENGTLQLLWIPDTTYHELAEVGSPYGITSPRLVPQVPPPPLSLMHPVDRPDNPLEDGDFGLQFSNYVKGWDITLNYLYHYLDTPLMPVSLLDNGQFLIQPEYQRSHLVGGTMSTAVGPVTIRGELAYSSDTFHPLPVLDNRGIAETAEVSSVIGVDWVPGIDTLLSAQWFNSYLLDYNTMLYRDESENLLTLLYQQDFANATWRFRAIGIHSLEDGDSLLQLKLGYWLLGNLELWLGADVFTGSASGLFGQFREQDRVLLGFRYGF